MNVQDVQKLPFDLHKIFQIQSDEDFRQLALLTCQFQFENCAVYRSYIQMIKRDVYALTSIQEIPFLPISFFKQHEVKSFEGDSEITFLSSGTTQQNRSKHYVADPTVYQLSFIKGFEYFYGPINDYVILGLLPSYMENEQSSLIYMVDHLIQLSEDADSGFFLNDYEHLLSIISKRKANKKILLIGVSYALLDFAEKYGADLSGVVVMETGGMKGRRKELSREELHDKLCKGLHVSQIHSEYGMTELFSQAYSKGQGIFNTPPWMKVLLRKTTDPFEITQKGTGGMNIIDLANIHSCSFIETEDLGRQGDKGLEILGRLDQSDIRGCNLLIQ